MTTGPFQFSPAGAPADGDLAVWDSTAGVDGRGAYMPLAAAAASAGVAGGMAHYAGSWGILTVYAAGDVVDKWDGAAWRLYQATSPNTGRNPELGAPWSHVTTPIVMWDTGNPNTAHDSDPNGAMIGGAPAGTVYVTADPTAGATTFVWDPDWWVQWVGISAGNDVVSTQAFPFVFGTYECSLDSAEDGNVVSSSGQAYRYGAGNGDASGMSTAERNGSGAGNASTLQHASVQETATGDADARKKAVIADSAVGTATAGDEATHHAGGTAQVLVIASATDAYISTLGKLRWGGVVSSGITPSVATKAIAVYDASGTLLGYLPLMPTIA
jgi:hypothetical protein